MGYRGVFAADCLRPMPLLDDREMLVWEKLGASTIQRRAISGWTRLWTLLRWFADLPPVDGVGSAGHIDRLAP